MSKFNLLSYILPPENKIFFELFQESADICRKSALLYQGITENHKDAQAFEDARKLKRKASKTLRLTLAQLHKSFITPLEREDIHYIASLLQKITKRIIRACLNLQVYRIESATNEMKEQADALVKSTNELCLVVKQLKKISDVQGITKSNIKMKEFESLGDDILRKAIDDLFSGKYDAMDVIKYRDIYKEIENALDACFSVSDAVLNIVLKQN